VITGGSSGIGLSALSLFAKAGAMVYNLDIQAPKTNLTGLTYLKCDVSNFEQVNTQISAIIKEHGQIHHAFLNAGVHEVGNVEDLSLDSIDRVININIKGIVYCLKCILPNMRQHQEGSIVLMGSDQSYVGKGDSFIYGATKGAIGQLTKSTAIDYAQYNVRINCVCPGTIDTPLYHNAVDNFSKIKGMDKDQVYKIIKTAQPISRVGLPEEVANTVLFLCSEKAGFSTGSLVSVDGGYVAQ
jgi:NAD(P)-dependent dehydrogenase (short-subunit alcohol dehydrogenase family)